MYQTGVQRPGAMAALLGELGRPIEEICAQATSEVGLAVPANYNCPGQLVISGEVDGVERAMQLAKEAGVKRAMRLNVSGAFHSPLMETASDGLAQALARHALATPQFPVWSNVTGEPVTEPARATSLLLEQLTSPVRWTDEVLAIAERHPDALYVEMGPGSVLTGLVKKIAPSLRTQTCGTVADIEQLLGIVG
jgi:[acyl-carrier-protein] S-malonyltransferase